MKFLDYIQGVRRGKAAHRVEYEAMGDSFLSEAIEGYDSIAGNHAERIARMQASVLARTTPFNRETRSGAWKVAIAAIAVIALLSGYFALMNHKSSMAVAHEFENSFINLYAPENYIEERRIELTAMIENNPSQELSVESVVPISNLEDVIKPIEVFPLYVPGVYVDLKKEGSDDENISADSKKIYIAEASSSILAEAKVTRPQTSKSQVMPDKLKDAWATKEVTEVTRSRVVEVNKENSTRNKQHIMGVTVSEDPKVSTTKETEATSTIKVDSHEARLLAKEAGFDEIEVVGVDELDGNALELNDVETTKRTISRESFYRPKATSSSSFASGSAKRTQPEPLIGQKEYKKYLKENAVLPKSGECKDKKGKVIVQLSVDKNGNPIDIYVKKALCKDLDREAVRLVKNGPKWKYGTLRVDVEVQF